MVLTFYSEVECAGDVKEISESITNLGLKQFQIPFKIKVGTNGQ